MKNIHILPTDEPSRLWINNLLQGKLELSKEILVGSNTAQNIYITSDEEIKEGEYGLSKLNEIVKFHSGYDYRYYAKIILTTDQDLIKDGVQSIDDDFLEWFVKNPSCEEVEVLKYKSNNMRKMNLGYKIILPKEEPNWEELENSGLDKSFKLIEEPKTAWVGVLHDKLNEYYPAEYELKDIYQGEGCLPNFPNEELCQIWCDSKYKEEPNYNMKQEILDEMKKQETLEEAAERILIDTLIDGNNSFDLELDSKIKEDVINAMIQLVKWQQQNSYSEEDMKQFGDWCRNGLLNTEYGLEKLDEHLEQWKQLKNK